MGTVFGKGSGKSGKPAGRDGKAGVADTAEWGARQEELRRALVRNGASTSRSGLADRHGDRAPTKPDNPNSTVQASASAPVDPTHEPLGGRRFSEVFTTESLFDSRSPSVSIHGRQTGLTPTPSPRRRTPAPQQPRVPTGSSSGQTPKAPPAQVQPRIPANHPAMTALEALGLDGHATWADVQRNYRALAKKAHPDFSGDSGVAMSTLNGHYQQLRAAQSYGLFGEGQTR